MTTDRTYPTVKHVQEVTLFKTERKAQAAVETLKWLDEDTPNKLDGLKGNFKFAMEEFLVPIGDTEYNERDCGTVCCIAGAIYALTNNMDGDKTDEYVQIDMFFGNAIQTSSGRVRYRLPQELNYLFYVRCGSELHNITPKQAARTLRKYLETGIVDWSHLDDTE